MCLGGGGGVERQADRYNRNRERVREKPWGGGGGEETR